MKITARILAYLCGQLLGIETVQDDVYASVLGSASRLIICPLKKSAIFLMASSSGDLRL
jgi:hypothetical protein